MTFDSARTRIMTTIEKTLKDAREKLTAKTTKRDNILAEIADLENTIKTLEGAGVKVPEPAPSLTVKAQHFES